MATNTEARHPGIFCALLWATKTGQVNCANKMNHAMRTFFKPLNDQS